MSKPKNKTIVVKIEGESSSRDKYLSSTDESSKFVLEWYIDLQKSKPPTFKMKKQQHLQCANAVNEKFALGATQSQVDRHYRSYKEKYAWIRRAMNNSGNGSDSTSCKFILSESETKTLPKSTVNYLTTPIKFYDLLEDLFSDQSQANGSFTVDQATVKELSSGEDDIDYGKAFDVDENDGNESDTIPRNSPIDVEDNVDPSSTSSKKRKRQKSPLKKNDRAKSARSSKISNDDIVASIKNLTDSLLQQLLPLLQICPP